METRPQPPSSFAADAEAARSGTGASNARARCGRGCPSRRVIADACGRALRRSVPALVGARACSPRSAAPRGPAIGSSRPRRGSRSPTIEVDGNHQLCRRQILAALPVAASATTCSRRTSTSIVRELRENPWIASAEAHRVLPHTLVDRRPRARAGRGRRARRAVPRRRRAATRSSAPSSTPTTAPACRSSPASTARAYDRESRRHRRADPRRARRARHVAHATPTRPVDRRGPPRHRTARSRSSPTSTRSRSSSATSTPGSPRACRRSTPRGPSSPTPSAPARARSTSTHAPTTSPSPSHQGPSTVTQWPSPRATRSSSASTSAPPRSPASQAR